MSLMSELSLVRLLRMDIMQNITNIKQTIIDHKDTVLWIVKGLIWAFIGYLVVRALIR